MSDEEILERVKKIIGPYCKVPGAVDAATFETHLMDDLEVNSARIVDIVLALEDEFDMEVEDDAIDDAATLGGAVRMIARAVA